MTEILDVVNGFSLPLKAAWIVWLAWGIGQIAWYRREHVEVVKALPVSVRPRRPSAVAPVAPSEVEGRARPAQTAQPGADISATAAPETPTLDAAEAS